MPVRFGVMPPGVSGLALLMKQRMAELEGSSPDGTLSAADLVRVTGIPRSTIYAYLEGRIRADRLNDDVRDKLGKIAQALKMSVEPLIAAARPGRPDYEAELLYLFRQLRSDAERERALLVMRQFVGIGRKRRDT